MKIAKDIQKKMHKVAAINQESQRLMEEIEEYLSNKGLNANVTRCGNGCSIEELEYGNDITDEFVLEAEKDFKSGLWDDCSNLNMN